jgi:tRNA threonylcarbamoyladenosine biosynthesis protein TsaB
VGAEGWMLAIDTSTECAGIALYDGVVACEQVWRAGRNQTSALLPEIERFLALNGLNFSDVGALGVAVGPGAFNGLRVGLSTAKGLCLGLGVPIVGVDTLEAAAYPHLISRSPVRAFVPAGRGRVVLADFRYRNKRWVRVGEMRNQPVSELTLGMAERTVLAGELSSEALNSLDEGARAKLPAPALRMRRPGYLGEIAYRRWQAGDVDDLVALEPVYVHGAPRP